MPADLAEDLREPECDHVWEKETLTNKALYYCTKCGLFSKSEPAGLVCEKPEHVEDLVDTGVKCRHIWRGDDRVHHKRGKAGGKKYTNKTCELCGKFQRKAL